MNKRWFHVAGNRRSTAYQWSPQDPKYDLKPQRRAEATEQIRKARRMNRDRVQPSLLMKPRQSFDSHPRQAWASEIKGDPSYPGCQETEELGIP